MITIENATLAEKVSIVYEGIEWTLRNNDYSTLELLDGSKKLSSKDFESKFLELLPAYQAKENAKLAEQKALKDSANSKLLALGLSPEEIAAITGA